MLAGRLRIVCTGKGAHPPRALAVLEPATSSRASEDARARGFFAVGSVTRAEPRDVQATPEGTVTGWAGVDRRSTVRAPVEITPAGAVLVPACPTCGRAPRLGREVVLAAAEALPAGDDGTRILDVSRIPS